jgi:hypothetical protein
MMRLSNNKILTHIKTYCAILYLAALYSCLITGCGSESTSPNEPVSIPGDCKPCEHPEYWPYSVASDKYPFVVHYHSSDELDVSRKVITELETAWYRQINLQGYTPPPSDEGMCGQDGRFDVFIWRGINTCQVNIVSEKFMTPWGGRASYMKLDPFGTNGGDILPQTVAHEFNHATHAANDWNEAGDIFEMSASYVEQLYGPSVHYCVLDFQTRPNWGLLKYDNYSTWYMYGSALYMHFLRDYYFNGDDSFLPELWVACRNTPDLYVNKPHIVDAFNSFLIPLGTNFENSVQEFARWRFYAGIRDDGVHFRRLPTFTEQYAFLPEATIPIDQITLSTLTYEVPSAQLPMLTGNVYLEIQRENATQTSFQVSINTQTNPTVRWVVQAVPGLSAGSDGEIVDLSSGPARVSFGPIGRRTLILTVLPAAGMSFNPNNQTDTTYPVSINIAP